MSVLIGQSNTRLKILPPPYETIQKNNLNKTVLVTATHLKKEPDRIPGGGEP